MGQRKRLQCQARDWPCVALPPDCHGMSKDRQESSYAVVVRSASVGFRTGYHWRGRRGLWGELVWAHGGVITVAVGQVLWVVPPAHALWLPAGTPSDVRLAGRGALRSVYIAPGAERPAPPAIGVVQLAPLLRELLRRVLTLGTLSADEPAQLRLLGVLLDELTARPGTPIELPMPKEARARRAALAMQGALREGDPDAPMPSAQHLAREASASVRTLERLFRAETGLSLGAWRQRARLVYAMTCLADGANVTAAGLAAGYASTSAFVAAFRRAVGVTPGRYAQDR